MLFLTVVLFGVVSQTLCSLIAKCSLLLDYFGENLFTNEIFSRFFQTFLNQVTSLLVLNIRQMLRSQGSAFLL